MTNLISCLFCSKPLMANNDYSSTIDFECKECCCYYLLITKSNILNAMLHYSENLDQDNDNPHSKYLINVDVNKKHVYFIQEDFIVHELDYHNYSIKQLKKILEKVINLSSFS